MTTEEIREILKTRVAVYYAGINAGVWQGLKEDEVNSLTNYLFPKSGPIAFYNLVMAFMQKEHSDIQGEAYYLYKLPAQLEKEISDYLKKNRNEIDFTKIVDDASDYLKERDTIVANGSLIPTSVGALRNTPMDDILRLFTKQYRYAFERKLKIFPFCD